MAGIKGFFSKILGNKMGTASGDEDEEFIADEYIEEDGYQNSTTATGTDDNVISFNNYQNIDNSRYNPNLSYSSVSYPSQKPKSASKPIIETYRIKDNEDAMVVCSNAKKNIIAIVNLADIEDFRVRQRLCDFFTGVAKGIDANLQKLDDAGVIFALVPKTAKIRVGDLVTRRDY